MKLEPRLNLVTGGGRASIPFLTRCSSTKEAAGKATEGGDGIGACADSATRGECEGQTWALGAEVGGKTSAAFGQRE